MSQHAPRPPRGGDRWSEMDSFPPPSGLTGSGCNLSPFGDLSDLGQEWLQGSSTRKA